MASWSILRPRRNSIAARNAMTAITAAAPTPRPVVSTEPTRLTVVDPVGVTSDPDSAAAFCDAATTWSNVACCAALRAASADAMACRYCGASATRASSCAWIRAISWVAEEELVPLAAWVFRRRSSVVAALALATGSGSAADAT
jgi:hypothetical protein